MILDTASHKTLKATGIEVVCVGETMAMVTPELSEPLEEASTLVVHPGGAESNVAMYLASLGHRVGWAGHLGDDPLGRRVLRDVAGSGVDVSLVEVDAKAPTGVFFKDPGADRSRVYYYRQGSAASLMSRRLLGHVLQRRPKLVHLTGITPALSPQCNDMMSALVVGLREAGTTISFDVNYRRGLWPPALAAGRLAELAQQSDVVFVGLDEAREVWGLSSPSELRSLLDRTRVLVVKDGGVGATAYHEAGSEFVPALKVKVIEPVGAGDAFAAGWLSGLLRGLAHPERLRLGHLVASRALMSTADYASLPDWHWFEGALSAKELEWQDVLL
jgi:2-dehydro-3-deoxygluconokinase